MKIAIIIIISMCIVMLYVLFFWKWNKNSQNFFTEDKKLIIGHRGSPQKITENTLPSFQRAIAQGVDGVELDIRLCKDGHIVVFHDEDLKRLANCNNKINELTLDEIQKIRLIKKKETNKRSTHSHT